MGLPGYGELVGLAIFGLMLFGPRKLPELMRGIGQGIAQFKRAVSEATSQLNDVVNMDPPSSRPDPPVTDYPDYTSDYPTTSDETTTEQPAGDDARADARAEDPNDRRLRPLF